MTVIFSLNLWKKPERAGIFIVIVLSKIWGQNPERVTYIISKAGLIYNKRQRIVIFRK
jgi:hypothetical protein